MALQILTVIENATKTEGEYWLGKYCICQMYKVLKDMNLMRLFTYHIIHVNKYLVNFFPRRS